MKYRIKIVTYCNGRKVYIPQVKQWFMWAHINYLGENVSFICKYDTRKEALDNIDKHYNGNSRVQNIEFEYINKK